MDDFGQDNGQPKKPGIDGNNVAEQVLAGVILLAIGATGAHIYDKYKYDRERKRRR